MKKKQLISFPFKMEKNLEQKGVSIFIYLLCFFIYFFPFFF